MKLFERSVDIDVASRVSLIPLQESDSELVSLHELAMPNDELAMPNEGLWLRTKLQLYSEKDC